MVLFVYFFFFRGVINVLSLDVFVVIAALCSLFDLMFYGYFIYSLIITFTIRVHLFIFIEGEWIYDYMILNVVYLLSVRYFFLFVF